MARSPVLLLLAILNSAFVSAQNSGFRPREISITSTSPGLIPGLLGSLQVRQSTCSAGYSLCPSDIVCCPLGGDCCSDYTCCLAGDVCYVFNGQIGCCPAGETCTSVGGCSVPTDVQCPNDTFCCPPGQVCSRVDGVPSCSPGSSVSSSASSPPPSSSSTTSLPPPVKSSTQPPATTTFSTEATLPPTTFTATPTTSVAQPSSQTTTVTPVPPPPSQTINASPVPTNATISPSSPLIKYSGNWQSASSICVAGGESKKCQGPGNSFTFSFEGTAIYVNIGIYPDGGNFSTTLDGVTTQASSLSTTGAQCAIGFTQVGLDNSEHTIVVKSLGQSSSAPFSSSGTLDFEGIIITQNSNTSTSSSSDALSSLYFVRTNLFPVIVGLILWCLVCR